MLMIPSFKRGVCTLQLLLKGSVDTQLEILLNQMMNTLNLKHDIG